MVLKKLGSSIKKVIDKIAGAIFIDKKTIDIVAEELKKSLIQADVDINIVYELIDKIKKSASSEKISGIERREQLIKLIHDEIVKILGKKKYELLLEKDKNYKIMIVGLYGSGKTTTIAKLALYYGKLGYKVCMVGLDTHRPAAQEQLEQLASRINLPAFIDKNEINPEDIWKKYEKKIKKYDLVLIDTAGRDALDNELINEIKKLDKLIEPEYILLVIPADIGQAAREQAAKFKENCQISGVILTRMDGTAKGGGALAACYETNSPVLFIGTGEHIRDIEAFNPTAFVSRMLGLGDIETLLEKVRLATISQKKEKETEKFSLTDMYEQLNSIQSMGPLKKIAELIPGFTNLKISSDIFNIQEEKLKKWKYAIDSMTKKEIENPELLEKETTRISRIAKGAGITSNDVRDLLSQYKIIRQLNTKQQHIDIDRIKQQGIRGLQNLGLSQRQLRKLAKRLKGNFNI